MANITNIKLDSLLISLINLSIVIAVISIITLIKNRLNSSSSTSPSYHRPSLKYPPLSPYR